MVLGMNLKNKQNLIRKCTVNYQLFTLFTEAWRPASAMYFVMYGQNVKD